MFTTRKVIATLILLAPLAANADLINETQPGSQSSQGGGPVSATQSGSQTTRGGELTLDFNGLQPSDGSDGTVMLASAPGSSFDLSDASNEYFELLFDGLSAGYYTCQNDIFGAIDMECGGPQSENTFSILLSFSQLLVDFGIDMPGLIADGALSAVVDFGPGMDIGFGERNSNTLDMTLAYNGITAVPAPGTLALLGIGLAGLGFSRRRKA